MYCFDVLFADLNFSATARQKIIAYLQSEQASLIYAANEIVPSRLQVEDLESALDFRNPLKIDACSDVRMILNFFSNRRRKLYHPCEPF